MPVRLAIEARTGGVRAARTVSAGPNSQLAVALETEAGTVFVKGAAARTCQSNRPGNAGPRTSTATPTWTCSTVMPCCTRTSTR